MWQSGKVAKWRIRAYKNVPLAEDVVKALEEKIVARLLARHSQTVSN